MEKSTTIGCLCRGNFFMFESRKYRIGKLIENTNGYVACVDVNTKKVKRFYIDTDVEVTRKE